MSLVNHIFCEAMKGQNISSNVNNCYAFISFLYRSVGFGCKNKLCFQQSHRHDYYRIYCLIWITETTLKKKVWNENCSINNITAGYSIPIEDFEKLCFIVWLGVLFFFGWLVLFGWVYLTSRNVNEQLTYYNKKKSLPLQFEAAQFRNKIIIFHNHSVYQLNLVWFSAWIWLKSSAENCT